MMINTNKPAIAGTKYVFTIDVGVAVGPGVAFCEGDTKKLFIASDGQYPLVPAKVA
jgi:hypothetical protein